MKAFEIWNSEINLEDWEGFVEEDQELNPFLYQDRDQETAIWERISEVNSEYLEDERMNLDIQLEHPILLIADLGTWQGRVPGYKIISSGNIRDILYSNTSGTSEMKWYCDGRNIRCEEMHHDGVNHYLYREIRNPENIHRLLDMIYNGEEVSSGKLYYYTRSIAEDVGRVYGFCE